MVGPKSFHVMSLRIYSVVETDNFGGDYPDESFIIRHVSEHTANIVADAINIDRQDRSSRFYKVVEDRLSKPYQLQPGFQP
jgi:hypothetical protein